MTGTVTITLADFTSLQEAAETAAKQQEGILQAAKELEVFLSFLCSRENISELIDEFNASSKSCKIRIIEGRAKIQITLQNEKHKD